MALFRICCTYYICVWYAMVLVCSSSGGGGVCVCVVVVVVVVVAERIMNSEYKFLV